MKPKLKPRNFVARAQQSGAGKHRSKADYVFKTAMRQAMEEALQERRDAANKVLQATG